MVPSTRKGGTQQLLPLTPSTQTPLLLKPLYVPWHKTQKLDDNLLNEAHQGDFMLVSSP